MDVIFYILVIAGCLITFSIGQACVGNFVAPPCTSQKNPSRQFFIAVNTTLINDVNCHCEVRLIKTPTESNKSSLFPVTFRIIDDVNCDYDVNVVYGTSSSSVVCKEAPTFTQQIVIEDSLLFAFLKRTTSSSTSSGFCLQVIADVRDTFITINCDENVNNSNQPDTSTYTRSTTEILPTSWLGFSQTESASSSWLSQPTTQALVSPSSQPTPPSQSSSSSSPSSSSSSSSSSSPPPSSSPSPSYQSTAYHSPSSEETTFTTASPITLLSPILTSSLTPASSTRPPSSSYHSPSSGEILFTTASLVTVLYPSQTPLQSSTPPSSPAAPATTQLNTVLETDTTATIFSETTNSELIPVIAAGVVAGVIIIIIFTILIICCCFRKKRDADEASVCGETRNENLFLVENDLYYSNVNNVAEFGGAPYSTYPHKSNTTKRPNGTIRSVEGEPCGEFERTSPRPNQFCERSTRLKRGLGEDADTSFQRKQRSPYSDSKYGESNLSNKRSVERRDSGKIDGNWNRSTSENSPYSTHSDYTPYRTMRSNTPTNLSEKSYFSNRKKRARRVYFDLPSETESDVSDIEENKQTDEASQELRLKQIREKNKRWQVLY